MGSEMCIRDSSLPDLQPFVRIFTDCDLLTTNEERDLEAAPESALGDPAFVALLYGVRSGGRIFWKDYDFGGGAFIDSRSGEYILQNRIPGAAPRHFLLLLRDGGRVPRCARPNWRILLCKRSGSEVRVDRGRVRLQTAAAGEVERWRRVKRKENFYIEFRDFYYDFESTAAESEGEDEGCEGGDTSSTKLTAVCSTRQRTEK